MGSSKVPDVETPKATEPVKHPNSESKAIRDRARQDAAQRFGALGTDLTKGTATNAVQAGNQQGKKKKLGGD